MTEGWEFVKNSLDESSQIEEVEEVTIGSVNLEAPDAQAFSIANIEMGMERQVIENTYGEPERETLNEYGLYWSTYHEEYRNFFMIMYDEEDKVRGLFTNQDLLSSQNNLSLSSTKPEVQDTLGEPEEAIQKGFTNYIIDSDGQYDAFHLDDSFVTFFYDTHEEDGISAVQLIDEGLERSNDQLYAEASNELQEGLKYQIFDLTNAERMKRDLTILTWSESASETAYLHSKDMAENDFFDHTNLAGQSPFDRMAESQIQFTKAAENLAYGQQNSIMAHQGLLNSEGHRVNILNDEFTYLGTGVSLNEEDQPFFTELFYRE